jgi:hypothetical protein
MTRQVGAAFGVLLLAHAGAAQFTQQGGKLVGWDAAGAAGQGESVAISGDGNTAVVGGPLDDSYTGAAWVFTRSGGVWSQESKLLGAGAVGAAGQGGSVAISADGNTAIVGGSADNSHTGAAWVFTRSGGVWSQQGGKLVGTGAVGSVGASQGYSVALSGDGNTAIVGGPDDNNEVGAAWVFTRSGGVWSEESKLVGAGAVRAALQGRSVSISADGNSVIIGGPGDDSFSGAIWVFTRSWGGWLQQGNKLVSWVLGGRGAFLGGSVALSGDGSTAIIGAPVYGNQAGAVWVFARSGLVWSAQAGQLVGAGAVGAAFQGVSVAISGDGNTALVGGDADDSDNGAAWVFTRSGGVWSQQGDKLIGTGAAGAAFLGGSVAISADGNTAILGGSGDNSNTGAAWIFVAGGCTSPSITSQPRSQSIVSGQTATLSVIASGTAPLSYRWYQGNAGDGLTPVGANASTFTTPPLESTTSYWVWVFNECGSTFSATATISVERRVRRHLHRAS